MALGVPILKHFRVCNDQENILSDPCPALDNSQRAYHIFSAIRRGFPLYKMTTNN